MVYQYCLTVLMVYLINSYRSNGCKDMFVAQSLLLIFVDYRNGLTSHIDNCHCKGTYTLQISFQGCSQYFPITKDASKCEGGDSFIFGNYKITELETILSNDNYIEREFLLERTSKWDSPTQSCCGPFVGGEPQEKDTDMQVYQEQHYIISKISGNDCTNLTSS